MIMQATLYITDFMIIHLRRPEKHMRRSSVIYIGVAVITTCLIIYISSIDFISNHQFHAHHRNIRSIVDPTVGDGYDSTTVDKLIRTINDGYSNGSLPFIENYPSWGEVVACEMIYALGLQESEPYQEYLNGFIDRFGEDSVRNSTARNFLEEGDKYRKWRSELRN